MWTVKEVNANGLGLGAVGVEVDLRDEAVCPYCQRVALVDGVDDEVADTDSGSASLVTTLVLSTLNGFTNIPG